MIIAQGGVRITIPIVRITLNKCKFMIFVWGYVVWVLIRT